jgi:tetratricopeptide (TPR) repeat protein
MMRRMLVLLGALTLGLGWLDAQEVSWREDLRFVESLRARNDNELALEFLNRMAVGASPELLKELPLEFAKTRLRVADEEADSGRRLDLYRQAREEFLKFLAANPGHPRTGEANLDIARVLNLQGKTELNRAQLNTDTKARKEESVKARATLVEGGKQLEAALAELEARRGRLPDPKSIEDKTAQKKADLDIKRIENEILQTKLERAINYYDQMQTYDIGGGGTELLACIKVLRELKGASDQNPVHWKARAWLGRCTFESETADKARKEFAQVLDTPLRPATADGHRLARYFRMLVIQKQPSEEEKKKGVNGILEDAAMRWLKDYPNYRKTPEGYGVAYLLAGIYYERAFSGKLAKGQTDVFLARARDLLRGIESTENEFTDRARRMKIEIIGKQGAFSKKVEELKTFEDCFIRSQYELVQLNKDATEIKEEKKFEEKRKERIVTITAALKRGLELNQKDKKAKPGTLELNTARASLAYWCLQSGRFEEAIQAGEAFARDDPRSSQAATASVYALQAYAQQIGKKQAEFQDVAEDRAAMLRLARYMEERWPRELPGDMARHQLGLQLMREENYPEAVKKLGTVSAGYPSYVYAQYQLADCALKAEKAGNTPIPGDRPGDYRKRAIHALENMPEQALGTSPATNHLFVMGKCILGRELFKLKRFQEMDSLANGLLKRVNDLKFHDEMEKDVAIRNQMRYELVDIGLFARYGLADAAYSRGEHEKVVELLGPLIETINKEGESQEKVNLQKNTDLATVMLSLALRSNLQLKKLEQTDAVLDTIDKVLGADGRGEGTTRILQLLAALIRQQVKEIEKAGDKEALVKAREGYTAILDKRIKKQKEMSNDFRMVLADCYSSMEQHDKAAEVLAKVPEPKAGAGDAEEKKHRGIQLILIRELRLSKSEANLKKASDMLSVILGPEAPRAKWGWGRSNLDALKENALVLEAKGQYKEAFPEWTNLVKNLAKSVNSNPRIKEPYFECFYHMVLSYLKREQASGDMEKIKKAVETAAAQIVAFEKSWEDFGSEASKSRFLDLLAKEPELKQWYEKKKK